MRTYFYTSFKQIKAMKDQGQYRLGHKLNHRNLELLLTSHHITFSQ